MNRATFTPEHVRQLRFARDAGFTPEGRHVFYTVAAIDDDLRERHSLWLLDFDGDGEPRRLADELDDLASPAPSPDGSTIAVLADVDGRQQVLLVPLDGGKVEVLTSVPQGVVGAPMWSPDSRSIAFTAGPANRRDPSLPYWIDRVTYRADALGYLDDVVTDLYVVDVETAAVRQLTDDRCMNSEPRWSPDSRSLAYLVSFQPDRTWTFLPSLHVLDVDSGATRPVVDSWGGVLTAEWSADGEQLVFTGAPHADKSIHTLLGADLWTIDLAATEPQRRTTAASPELGLAWLQNDLPVDAALFGPRLRVHGDVAYVNGQTGGRVTVYRVALAGPETVEPVVDTDASAALVDFHPDRGVLHFSTSFVEPPELVLDSRRLTALNDELLGGVSRPTVQKLEVTAPDGVQSEAWALTPPGPGPWPTVLYVHGGPWGAFGEAYVIDFQLLVGAGFAVIANNFRGSRGYGEEFLRRVSDHWGRQSSLDHHAAVDEAIRLGIADAELLGVCGLSFGGFATCWLLGTSDRFRAGVAENPVTNLDTFYGVTDAESWVAEELGGRPWEVPEVYRDWSPLTYAPNCKSPLLFVVGETDLRCHQTEAEQYYRVLKTNGVPTKMLRLPNSSHGGTIIGPVPGRLAQNVATVEWFRQYLVTTPDTTRGHV